MTGKLYVIGVGPGDPELLTIKGMRILKEVPCICVPKGREEGSSLALSIVKKIIDLDRKEIIEAHFPMRKTRDARHRGELGAKWHETVDAVFNKLSSGVDMAFITIGDPAIYSTFFYLYDRLLELNPDFDIEIVPGVSSISASASRAKMYLGLADEKIAIIPANYADNLPEVLGSFDTLVFMKVHKELDKIRKALEEISLTGNATYIAKTGMGNEEIIKNIRDVREEDLNYFSMVIVRR